MFPYEFPVEPLTSDDHRICISVESTSNVFLTMYKIETQDYLNEDDQYDICKNRNFICVNLKRIRYILSIFHS